MAKRKKHLTVLFIFLLVVSLITVIVKNIKVEKEKIANIEETVIDIDSNDIDSINFSYSNKSLSLIKENDVWCLEDDLDFPIDQDKVNDLLKEVSEVDVSFVITDVSDYDQYGLSSPSAKVNFVANEKEYSIEFGDYSQMDQERYINIDDGNVYLLTSDIMDDFNITKDDLFAYEEVPGISTFNEMIISGENDLDIIYDSDNDYTYSKKFVYFLKNKNNKTLGNSEVTTLANRIADLDFNDYACYTANSTDLSAYGLDDPRITVKFNYLDENETEQEFIIHLSTDEILEDEDDMNYYIRIDGSNNIYKTTKTIFNAFKDASYDSLRPSEVLLLDAKDITQIDIELDDEEYQIISKVEKDDITYLKDDEEIEFEDVVTAIQDLEIEEYTNDIPQKTMELSLKLHLDNEKYPTLTIKIYKYDSSNCILVFNDSYKALVNREDVVNLIEEINNAVLD